MISITLGNRRDIKLQKIALPLVFWLGVWQFAAKSVGQELLLPGPVVVLKQLLELAGTMVFWQSAACSLFRVFFGFLAGGLAGVFLASLSAAFHWLDWILAPAVRVIRAIPVASFILLLMLWFHTGMVPIACAALIVMPVVWGNVRKGIEETDPLLLEAAKAYRFTRRKTIRLVYIPSVRPYFASGCITSLGLAWKAGIAAEVLSHPKMAVGLEMQNSKIYLETPSLFAWTLVVIVMSFLLERLLLILFQKLGRGRRP